MPISHCVRVRVAAVTIVAVFASPIAPLIATQAPAAQPPAAVAVAPPNTDGGWPRSLTTASGAALVVYQPQISTWVDQKHVVAYSAVSYTPKGATKSALGTIKL